MTTEHLRTTIEANSQGKRVQAMRVVKDNSEFVSLLSKLHVAREKRPVDNKGMSQIEAPDRSNFGAISKDISQRSNDAESIMQLFPEMELSAQILISSVLAPKDMSTTEINYTIPDGLKVSPIAAPLLTAIQEYFEQTYKIETLLPDILREMLFGSGAHPVAVIPENSVDELINGSVNISTESLGVHIHPNGVFKPLGFLGDPIPPAKGDNLTLESIAGLGANPLLANKRPEPTVKAKIGEKNNEIVLEHIFVTDNPNALKMPRIIERQRQMDIATIMSRSSPGMAMSLEGFAGDQNKSNLNDVEITNLFYKNRTKGYSHIVKVKTDDELQRSTIGAPLIINLPAESCIPVFTPGNEKRHVAYFVLLDAEGNPLSKHSTTGSYSDLRSRLNDTSDQMSSHLLNQASKINGTNCASVSFDQAAKVYSEIIDANLKARLRTGIMGSNMELGDVAEVSRVMLARVLMKQNTQILFVPLDLVTYYAYRYTDQGTGKSLLDDMRILNSLRAMLLFSQVMASVKNSIGRTRVKLKLSENDPNPQKTIEIGMHEIMKTRQAAFPLTMTTPSGLVDWVQKAGVEFEFEGHPGIPDTAVEFSETATNYQKPDTELMDDLKDRAIMATGLSPETVDAGRNTEFATTAVQNNLLLTKRVKQIQEAFVPQVTDNCRKVAINDGNLIAKIKGIIRENLPKLVKVKDPDEFIAKNASNEQLLIHVLMIETLSNFEVSLSSPDNITLENQMAAFDKQLEYYEKAIALYVNDQIAASAMVGEQAAQRAEELKAQILGVYMRRWMAEKHILPELAELISTDEEGNPVINIPSEVENHSNALAKSITRVLQKTVPVGQAADRDIQQISGGEDLGESTASGGGFGGGGGGFDDGGSGGGDGMGDIPSFDDIPGLEDTPETTDEPKDDNPDSNVPPDAAPLSDGS